MYFADRNVQTDVFQFRAEMQDGLLRFTCALPRLALDPLRAVVDESLKSGSFADALRDRAGLGFEGYLGWEYDAPEPGVNIFYGSDKLVVDAEYFEDFVRVYAETYLAAAGALGYEPREKESVERVLALLGKMRG